MPEEFCGFSKIVSFKTNNVNAQILGFLLNVLLSYAKIRVPDPLLVYRPVIESSHYIVVNIDLINKTNRVTPNSKEYRSLVQSVTTYYIIVMKIYIPIQTLL